MASGATARAPVSCTNAYPNSTEAAQVNSLFAGSLAIYDGVDQNCGNQAFASADAGADGSVETPLDEAKVKAELSRRYPRHEWR